jgi:predicted permease
LSPILLGVAPVFVLLALGWVLKVRGFLPEDGWGPVERLTYFVFYPGFLIPTMWTADFTGASAGIGGLAAVLSVLVIGGLGLLAKPLIGLNGPSYTSVFQGIIRWNAFVFLPVVRAVFGQEGLAVAAVVLGLIIPVTNVLSVLVLSRWGEGQGAGWKSIGRAFLLNPIIVSCVVGLSLNLAHVPSIEPLYATLRLVGDAALPLGLIIAGAGLSFRYAASRPVTIGLVTFVKIVAMPLLMWGMVRLLGGSHLAQGVAICCGAAPGAAASYVMARQMGGDAPLMAGIVAFTTVGSAVMIPLLLWVFSLTT